MLVAFKLAGAALIALAMMPNSAVAVEIVLAPRDSSTPVINAPVVDVTPNGPVTNAPVIDVTPNTPVNSTPVIDVTPNSPVTGTPVIDVTPNGPVINVPVLDIDERPLELAVACVVTGTPVEFPDDLMLINQGAPLESGTTIKWKIKSVAEGYVQLNKQLPTGATVKAIGVLEGGVEAGKPCSAKII